MRVARILVPIALTGLVLAGCGHKKDSAPTTPATTAVADNGIKALSADDILKKALAALTEAGSFHVNGEVTQDAQALNVDVKVKGLDAVGTVTFPGATMKVLRIGSDAYIQADAPFWKMLGGQQGEMMAILLKDKWVKTTADNKDFAAYADLVDPQKLLTPEGAVAKGEVTTLNGASCQILLDSKDNSKLYIATTGKPYPVRIENTTVKSQLDFSEFGATFEDITAPPANQVIDLNALMGK